MVSTSRPSASWASIRQELTGSAVEQHRAGAALAGAAAVLGAGKADLVADDLEQRALRVDEEMMLVAVDRDVQLPLHADPPFSAQARAPVRALLVRTSTSVVR